MNMTPLVWWLLLLAILLDVYLVWVWRRYRTLRQMQAESEGKQLPSYGKLLWMAMNPQLQQNTEQDSPPEKENSGVEIELGEHSPSESTAAESGEQNIALTSSADGMPAEDDDQSSIAWFKTLLLLIGIGMVAFGLWAQKEGWESGWVWGKWVSLVAGLVLFAIGQQINEEKGLPRWVRRLWGGLSRRLDAKSYQIVLLVFSLILTVVASLAAGGGKLMRQGLVAVLAWVIGIVFAIAGGWQSTARKKVSAITLYTVGLLVLGAFLIRFIDVSNIPVVLSGDEASAGLNAVEFIDGSLNNIFRVGWNSFPTFYFFIQSIPIRLFGQTTLALRFLSVIAGALTIGALYLMVKAMFDNYVALLSAIFLASLHYHNHFSRIGLNNIWDGFLFVVVLGLLWYGWEKEDRRAFLFSGLFLGLSQYFYVSGRTLYLFVPAWFVLVGIFDWPKFKRNFSNLILLELVALVAFFPLAKFFIDNPREFMAPMRRVSLLGPWLENEIQITGQAPWRIILDHIGLSFMGYTHIPVQFWYKPFEPILRFLPATLFFLGLSSLIIRIHQTRMILLGMWLLTIGVMGGLSESTPAAQRYVAVAPVLAVMVGYGLSLVVSELNKLWKTRRQWISALAILAMVALGADELRFYLNDYTPESEFGGVNTLVAQELADYLQYKSSAYQVFFFGHPRMGYRSISSTVFLAPHIEGINITEPWGSSDNTQPSSEHLIFVFLPEHALDLEAVKKDYPSGVLTEQTRRQDEVLFWLYEVSPDT
jgi:4-amino-4-deoxy-L-arabinose transferase-like glycosyltransferase